MTRWLRMVGVKIVRGPTLLKRRATSLSIKPNKAPRALIEVPAPLPTLPLPKPRPRTCRNPPFLISPRSISHCRSPCIHTHTPTPTHSRAHAWLDVWSLHLIHRGSPLRRDMVGAAACPILRAHAYADSVMMRARVHALSSATLHAITGSRALNTYTHITHTYPRTHAHACARKSCRKIRLQKRGLGTVFPSYTRVFACWLRGRLSLSLSLRSALSPPGSRPLCVSPLETWAHGLRHMSLPTRA